MAPLNRTESASAHALGILNDAARRLARAGIGTARLDCELMMAHAAGVSRVAILSGPGDLPAAALERFDAMLVHRLKREPLAYILGAREFYSLTIEVSPAVLIPRPETEVLVAAALDFITQRPNARVLDIGTGSGAISIAIAANAPGVSVVAADISQAALAVARRNFARHHLEGRIAPRWADIFTPCDGGGAIGEFDLIVSNPPYVEAAALDSLEPELRDYEPVAALVAGADALECYRKIAAEAGGHLRRGGAAIVEVGAGQAAAVCAIFRDAGLRVAGVINDLAGIERVVTARS